MEVERVSVIEFIVLYFDRYLRVLIWLVLWKIKKKIVYVEWFLVGIFVEFILICLILYFKREKNEVLG